MLLIQNVDVIKMLSEVNAKIRVHPQEVAVSIGCLFECLSIWLKKMLSQSSFYFIFFLIFYLRERESTSRWSGRGRGAGSPMMLSAWPDARIMTCARGSYFTNRATQVPLIFFLLKVHLVTLEIPEDFHLEINRNFTQTVLGRRRPSAPIFQVFRENW